MLRALEICRPTACGILPLPTLGVKPVQKVKLHREMKLPPWMHQHLGENEAPGVHGGQALGHAKRLEESKQEKVPQQLSSKEMPKSVEEAEALIRSTFGASAGRGRCESLGRTHICITGQVVVVDIAPEPFIYHYLLSLLIQ